MKIMNFKSDKVKLYTWEKLLERSMRDFSLPKQDNCLHHAVNSHFRFIFGRRFDESSSGKKNSLIFHKFNQSDILEEAHFFPFSKLIAMDTTHRCMYLQI